MHLPIEIPAEIEAALLEKAARRGLEPPVPKHERESRLSVLRRRFPSSVLRGYMRNLFLLLAVLLLVPIAGFAGNNALKSRAAQEDDIREAVFRYQFKHNDSGLKQNAKAYYLSLGGKKDPSDQFLARFKGHRPAVKKASEATASAFEGVKDRTTGERGLIFNTGKIKWIKDDRVEVGGGYYESGMSASGNTYYVVKKNNRWIVTGDKMHWIS